MHTCKENLEFPYINFLFHGANPLVGQDLRIIAVSRSHSDTRDSIGHLCTSDQLAVETSTSRHTTLTADIHATGGIQTWNPSKRDTSVTRLGQRCKRDRLSTSTLWPWSWTFTV